MRSRLAGGQVLQLRTHSSEDFWGGGAAWFLLPMAGSFEGERGLAFKEPFKLQPSALGHRSRPGLHDWRVLGLRRSSCAHLEDQDMTQATAQTPLDEGRRAAARPELDSHSLRAQSLNPDRVLGRPKERLTQSHPPTPRGRPWPEVCFALCLLSRPGGAVTREFSCVGATR